MKAKQYVRVTKVDVSDTPEAISQKWDEHIQGVDNGNVSIPVDYWVEGYLHYDVVVGGAISIDRKIRNGVEIGGHFMSSCVNEIKGNVAVTQNSKYIIEVKELK